MKYARLIFANLLRNKRRTFLTMISIAVSLFVFCTLASLPGVAEEILNDRTSLRLLCHSKAGITYALPDAYRNRIIGQPHVELVTAFSFFFGVYRSPSDLFPNAAVDPDRFDEMWPDWGISPQAAYDFKHVRTACMVGSALLRRFDWHVGQKIMLHGTQYPTDLTLQIVGVFGGKGPPPVLIFRRDYLEQVLGRSPPVNMFWVQVDRAESISPVISELDHTFANSEAETQTETEKGFFAGFIQNLRTIFAMARILGLIVVIAISLVAANTAAMSIRERRMEFAVMRSIGFPSSRIMVCLLMECLLIGITGGLIGASAAVVVLKVARIGSSALGPIAIALRVPHIVIAETLLLALVIGIGSGVVPAASTLRRNVVDGLRLVT